MARTNAFMAVAIPDSKTATLNDNPPKLIDVNKTIIITGANTSFTNETNNESVIEFFISLKSNVNPNEIIIKGTVD